MWKKYGKISVMFGLFFLVFGLGFFSPDRLFAIADEKRGAAAKLDNAIPLSLPDAEQAAIEKKLHLLYQMPSLHFFTLDFDEKEFARIGKVLKREIKNLQKYKLLPKKIALTDIYQEKYCILDTNEPNNSLTMWFIWKQVSQYGALQLWIETESEKIMAINFTDEKKHYWKPAKKAFRKYLCKELSIDAKDIPEFDFYYIPYGYTITSECFLAYQQTQEFTDTAYDVSHYPIITTSPKSAAKY